MKLRELELGEWFSITEVPEGRTEGRIDGEEELGQINVYLQWPHDINTDWPADKEVELLSPRGE